MLRLFTVLLATITLASCGPQPAPAEPRTGVDLVTGSAVTERAEGAAQTANRCSIGTGICSACSVSCPSDMIAYCQEGVVSGAINPQCTRPNICVCQRRSQPASPASPA